MALAFVSLMNVLASASTMKLLALDSEERYRVKEMDLYSPFIVVLHTQGAQVRITQCYLQITPYLPLPRKHSPWRIPRLRLRTSNCSLLLIYLLRKDKRLSRPGWLTYSGLFTHISGHPSAAGRAQDSESSPVRDRRSTTGALSLASALMQRS